LNKARIDLNYQFWKSDNLIPLTEIQKLNNFDFQKKLVKSSSVIVKSGKFNNATQFDGETIELIHENFRQFGVQTPVKVNEIPQ